jgi:hypothetical protein
MLALSGQRTKTPVYNVVRTSPSASLLWVQAKTLAPIPPHPLTVRSADDRATCQSGSAGSEQAIPRRLDEPLRGLQAEPQIIPH